MTNGGYLGRNPNDSASTIIKKTYYPSGIQTSFSFVYGYTPGYIDCYINGSRIIPVDDFTATDGLVVDLKIAAGNGDSVELVAFEAFDVGSVTQSEGNFSVAQNLTVTGNVDATGNVDVDGRTDLDDLVVTGVSTFSNTIDKIINMTEPNAKAAKIQPIPR